MAVFGSEAHKPGSRLAGTRMVGQWTNGSVGRRRRSGGWRGSQGRGILYLHCAGIRSYQCWLRREPQQRQATFCDERSKPMADGAVMKRSRHSGRMEAASPLSKFEPDVAWCPAGSSATLAKTGPTIPH